MPILTFENLPSKKTPITAEILEEVQKNLLEMMYPIGSHYENADINKDPAEELGFGEWELTEGVVIVGASRTDSDFFIGSKGGNKSHQHNMPIAIDNLIDNWGMLHWNNSFNYGKNTISSPNHLRLNGTPVAETKTLYQLKTDNQNHLQPYRVDSYIWTRKA